MTGSTYEGPHESLALVLKTIEQHIHRDGWGKTPLTLVQAYRLTDNEPDPDDPSIDITHYTVSTTPLTGDPVRELQLLTALMESPIAPLAMALTDNRYQCPPTAHALIGEVYFHDDDEEYKSFAAVGIDDVRDMPGTKLSRLVIAIIGKDEYLMCQRVKGETLQWLFPSAAELAERNHPLHLLTRIHRANIDTWHRVFGSHT